MQAYVDPEHSASLDDWAFSLAFAADQARYAFPVQPMQPCKNVDCDNKSFAVFCSEPCRVAIEGDDTEDYYADRESDTLLGHRQTADQQWQQDQQAGGFAALVCGVQPQPVPVVPTLPEAPCSMNVHVELAGRQVQVTLRGVNEAEVLTRLETLLSRYPLQAAAVQDPPHVCPIHHANMEQQTNAKGSWWSHKAVDGSWCKGQVKGQVRHG